MSQAPKFLLGGVNKWYNFLGLRTMQTASYGVFEAVVKVAPVIAFVYGIRKLKINLILLFQIDITLSFSIIKEESFYLYLFTHTKFILQIMQLLSILPKEMLSWMNPRLLMLQLEEVNLNEIFSNSLKVNDQIII